MKKMELIAFLLLPLCLSSLAADPARKARRWQRQILTLDTHCDTPSMLLRPGWDIGKFHTPGAKGSGRQDFIRMKAGHLAASFFAVFVGQGKCTAEAYVQAKAAANETLAALDRMFATYPRLAGLALTPADARQLKKRGKLAIFLGLENGYPIGEDLNNINEFYGRGIRYITLAHTADNQICSSSTDHNHKEDLGLSAFGRQVVERMNKLGIMVDVSHISDRSFFDVLQVSHTPVIASHSSARALCDQPRNLSDDMLRALKKNGGVIQICILSDYIKKSPPNPDLELALAALEKKFGPWEKLSEADKNKAEEEMDAVWEKYKVELATVHDAVDHIDHVVRLIGIDHVGIGTDFDGGGGLQDCHDVTELVRITEELVRRGYRKQEIAKIWGGNALRVLQQVMDFATRSKTP